MGANMFFWTFLQSRDKGLLTWVWVLLPRPQQAAPGRYLPSRNEGFLIMKEMEPQLPLEPTNN